MTADTIGGVWTYAIELIRVLEPYGMKVSLATLGAPLTRYQRRAVQALSNVELFESTFKLEWMHDSWGETVEAGRWLLSLEREVQPEIIHLNGYMHGALSFRAPTLVVGHSCVYSWFEAVKGSSPGPEWEQYRSMVQKGLRNADLVTAPSETMLRALQKYYGFFKSGGAVYNGRNVLDFWSAEKEPFILTAGRLWDEAKNIAVLDVIAPSLSWPVYIAGELRNPDGGTVQFASTKHLGSLDSRALGAYMSRASIYALPARYEPFGLTPVEAALSGCALVLGDITSLREIWSEAALFVNPNDSGAIRDAIERLVQNDSLRQTMAERAKERAQMFSLERMRDGYLTLYDRLLASHKFDIHRREPIRPLGKMKVN